ncbi:MAG TPA: tetratricopeptide repeat protein [Opitutaceae bacterium]
MSERTEALLRKATAEHLAGRVSAAAALYGSVLRETPLDFRALHLGGAAAYQLEQMDLAASLFQRAIRVKPDSGPTLVCLGLALAELGRTQEAEENLKAGLALDARNPEAWLNLGGFLLTTGRNQEGMSCYRQALKLKPGYPAAFAGLGEALKAEGQAAQAIAHYSMALKLDPRNAVSRLGLIQTLQSVNRVGEALQENERFLADQPRHVRASSCRLFLLNYLETLPASRLAEEHRAFGQLFPAAARRRFTNSRDPEKRLRVAFLSPDLRAHSVAYFLEPLLAHLDRSQIEVVLYHDNVRTDPTSKRLAAGAALWRNFWGRGDANVEATLRSDAPDILVDLAGHSGQNRVHLFARRLAPLQVTYLGYPNTTGVSEMDYRFTDETADPVGEGDRHYVERLVRFAPCAWAYGVTEEMNRAGRIPAAGQGASIAFGSFNNLCKLGDRTLGLWGRLLAEVEGSRLVLKAFGLEAERIKPRLSAAGIDPARVSLLPPERDIFSHLECYRNVDIALDPFPYGGTTTTCEALWMGRPVVTLAGDRHASRVGASLLGAIERSEWVAKSPDDFVRIAAGLARDRAGLREVSAGLRQRLAESAIFDHAGQARRFGDGLRACWRHWCDPEVHPEPAAGASVEDAELARV